jgi:hypothetical protein
MAQQDDRCDAWKYAKNAQKQPGALTHHWYIACCKCILTTVYHAVD